MGLPVQVVTVNGEEYFICHATGVLIKHRFFFPGKQMHGCFISLPVALRWLLDQDVTDEQFNAVKDRVCAYFSQDDIPIYPASLEPPVGFVTSAREFLSVMEMGENWTLVARSQHVDDYIPPDDARIPKKRRKTEGAELDEAWQILFS